MACPSFNGKRVYGYMKDAPETTETNTLIDRENAIEPESREQMELARTAVKPRVVIVGAGFGGLRAARALREAPVQVTVIDRNNYHLFQPLLYQVATAS